MSEPAVRETLLGPGLPTLVIGEGPRHLVMLPGLAPAPGQPTGRERQLATSGWEPLLDGYTIYRLNPRVRPVGTTFEEMAEDVAAAIESLDPPVDLMGASTGGALAVLVASSRPDLVRRLVLVISGIRLSDEGQRKRRVVVAAIEDGRWRRVFGEMFTLGGPSTLWRAALFELGFLLGPRLVGIPDDPTLIRAQLHAWGSYDGTDAAQSIKSPTLLIGGERDRGFPPVNVRELAERIPTAQLVIAPGIAHSWPPDAMGRHIAPFLE